MISICKGGCFSFRIQYRRPHSGVTRDLRAIGVDKVCKALCHNIAPAIASWSVVVDSWVRYIIVSLWSIDFRIGEMRRPSGAWSSTESRDEGREVITKDPWGRRLDHG